MKFVAGDDSPRQFAQRMFKKLEEVPLPVRTGKMIFKQGEGVSGLMVQRPKNEAELSVDIYKRLKSLQLVYQDLNRFSPRQEIDEMIEELEVVIFVMGKITQTKNGKLPERGESAKKINSFCDGVVLAQKLNKEIQSDMRRLLRLNENQNIDMQLLIIMLTLQDQRWQIAEFGC